jgi:hypothetical protein
MTAFSSPEPTGILALSWLPAQNQRLAERAVSDSQAGPHGVGPRAAGPPLARGRAGRRRPRPSAPGRRIGVADGITAESIGILDHRGAGRRRRTPPGRARARRRDLNGLAASVARTVAGLVASAAEDLGRVRRPGRPLGLGRPLTLAYHHVPASRGSGRSPSPAAAAVSGVGAGPGRARLPSVGGSRRRGGRSGRGW